MLDLTGTPMKPSLHIKVWILLGYVILCTLLVLFDQQPDEALPGDDQDQGRLDRSVAVHTG